MFTCRNQLARVFDMIYDVNLLDSRDSANLQLLGRPDLSVTFTKFHCWRLTMFEKAVFLDADTLVIACTYVKVSLFFSNSLNNHEVRLQTHTCICANYAQIISILALSDTTILLYFHIERKWSSAWISWSQNPWINFISLQQGRTCSAVYKLSQQHLLFLISSSCGDLG